MEDNNDDTSVNEFELFPLFSNDLTKVQLNEEIVEETKISRPIEYYKYTCNKLQRKEFEQVAIDGDSIFNNKEEPISMFAQYHGRVIDLKRYNDEVEKNNQDLKRIKKRRMGQKQRKAKRLAQMNILKRKEIRKNIKKLKRKNEKKMKPIFRTEG
ncbi:hypothetical protein TBLA_0B05830 [Henningerozyma blattae CBS 6284]|uniref:Uncharacterized protein n=1 Tax=Henningerozyma blattae (strain ATCC 34711 / CBS 6284 / DSM 70876 / NBRC 10599 / NRRL Y-10934 / UCD 77-7) TaxID=1071380 RepID=I2GZ57_HENB6|nr:hypothetical protein TBLA_0B05830 [Tetrapisispora blattae CBS 6284]CCH59409.1 hypothetical protein TBLA_0B05830 [Tetrapisispora blattae CBS 6284]